MNVCQQETQALLTGAIHRIERGMPLIDGLESFVRTTISSHGNGLYMENEGGWQASMTQEFSVLKYS